MHSMFGGLRSEGGGCAATLIPPEPKVVMKAPYFSYDLSVKPKLIGLTAPARAGKDTVGGILAKNYGAQLVAFANPLREGLRTMIPGLTDEHFFGSLKEVEIPWLGKSPRQMMQTLGTEWGRNSVNQDLWLLIAKKTIQRHMNNYYHVAVTDVRFENEAEMIRDMGGQVWHIRRGSAPRVSAHLSEAGVRVQASDVVIDNNGSLEQLEESVRNAFNA